MPAEGVIQKIAFKTNEAKKRYYRKNYDFFELIKKIKLWPSRTGMLHGIKEIKIYGNMAEITTHCGEVITVRRSRNSRASRWLRNKWAFKICPSCKIPAWKLEKYASTVIRQDYGKKI